MQPGNGLKPVISEVATRGFRMKVHIIETDDEVAPIDELGDLGYAEIEAASFTSPKAISALRDAEAVMQRIRRAPQAVHTALVPDVRGRAGRRPRGYLSNQYSNSVRFWLYVL